MRFLFVISVLISAVCSPVTVEANGLIVSPLLIDHDVEARSIERDQITVVNTTNARIDVFPTVNNISLGADGGIEKFLEPSMSDRTTSLASWLEISRAPLELWPGASTTIELTLHVNPDPKPGTYHALVSFPIGRNRDEAEATIARGGVPGVIVNATIEEKSNELMSLSRFSIDRFVTTPENQAITYFVENTGDTETVPTGDIIVYNQRGEEVTAIPVNPDGVRLSPGESKTFNAPAPTAGLMGKYKAYLTVQYGDTQRAQLQDAAFFYVIPWKKLLALFGGLALVALALALLVHRKFARDDEYDEDGDHLPVYIRDSRSPAVHHDIDMKPRV